MREQRRMHRERMMEESYAKRIEDAKLSSRGMAGRHGFSEPQMIQRASQEEYTRAFDSQTAKKVSQAARSLRIFVK